jgi:hypothetical protein
MQKKKINAYITDDVGIVVVEDVDDEDEDRGSDSPSLSRFITSEDFFFSIVVVVVVVVGGGCQLNGME